MSTVSNNEETSPAGFQDAGSGAIDGKSRQNYDISQLLKEEKIAKILDLTAKIDLYTNNIRNTKRLYDKYDNENQYLQDYIGTLMNSNEIRK